MSVTKKSLVCALMVTVGLVLGYIESTLFPITPFYGLKIGFSNLSVLFVLYCFGVKYACAVALVKATLSGLLFSGTMSIFYSATGIIFAVFGMFLLKKANRFSIYGVSVAGSALFQVGQILIACLMLKSYAPFYYLAYLLIGSVPCGLISGGIVWIIGKHTRLFKEFIYEKKDGC